LTHASIPQIFTWAIFIRSQNGQDEEGMAGLLLNPSIIWIILGGILLTILLRWQFAPRDRERSEVLFVSAVLAYVSCALCMFVITRLQNAMPVKYDYFLFRVDGLLGFQPSFAVGRLFYHHNFVMVTAGLAYNCCRQSYSWCLPFTYIVPN
jgi:hypothetical protein